MNLTLGTEAELLFAERFLFSFSVCISMSIETWNRNNNRYGTIHK